MGCRTIIHVSLVWREVTVVVVDYSTRYLVPLLLILMPIMEWNYSRTCDRCARMTGWVDGVAASGSFVHPSCLFQESQRGDQHGRAVLWLRPSYSMLSVLQHDRYESAVRVTQLSFRAL